MTIIIQILLVNIICICTRMLIHLYASVRITLQQMYDTRLPGFMEGFTDGLSEKASEQAKAKCFCDYLDELNDRFVMQRWQFLFYLHFILLTAITLYLTLKY